MYDVFLKLLREELATDKLPVIDPSRLRGYYEFIEAGIENLIIMGAESRRYFDEALRASHSDASRLIDIRLMKKALNPGPHEGFDKLFLDVLDKLRKFYREYMAGFYVTSGDRIAVITTREIRYKGRNIGKNSLVMLGLKDALILYLGGSIIPIIKPYFEEIIG